MSNSELFKNIDRSLYTFNFNNIVELCFDKVVNLNYSNSSNGRVSTGSKLTDNEKALLDNCIDKYMLSFNIVKETSNEHLEKLFEKKR